MTQSSIPEHDAQSDGGQVAEHVVIALFSGGQKAMDEIAVFHLRVRQWQVKTENNIFSDILESQADLTHIHSYYLCGNGNFFVARTADTNKLVGIIGLKDEGNGQGVLKRLAVDPGHHRQGIGTRLVDFLVAWAQEHSFSIVTLTTGERENAKPIYEKAGFRVVGRVGQNNDYIMELDLTSQTQDK